MRLRPVGILLATLVLAAPSSAAADQKIGGDNEWSNERFDMLTPNAFSLQGAVRIDLDSVRVTLHRQDIGLIYHLPAVLAHAENTTSQPLCFSFEFEPSSYDDELHFGSGRVYYLGAHDRSGYIAGVQNEETAASDRHIGMVKMKVRTWAPIAKRQCGEMPPEPTPAPAPQPSAPAVAPSLKLSDPTTMPRPSDDLFGPIARRIARFPRAGVSYSFSDHSRSLRLTNFALVGCQITATFAPEAATDPHFITIDMRLPQIEYDNLGTPAEVYIREQHNTMRDDHGTPVYTLTIYTYGAPASELANQLIALRHACPFR